MLVAQARISRNTPIYLYVMTIVIPTALNNKVVVGRSYLFGNGEENGVCVNRSLGAKSATELWGGFYKPQSVTVQTLDSVTYCYVYYLALPDFLISSIATTQVYPPNWACS